MVPFWSEHTISINQLWQKYATMIAIYRTIDELHVYYDEKMEKVVESYKRGIWELWINYGHSRTATHIAMSQYFKSFRALYASCVNYVHCYTLYFIDVLHVQYCSTFCMPC